MGHLRGKEVTVPSDLRSPSGPPRLTGWSMIRKPGAPMASADRPLRIALLAYRGKPHCGGQGIYVRHLSKALVDLGHTVEVFGGPPYPELDPRVKLTKLPSLEIYNDYFPM